MNIHCSACGAPLTAGAKTCPACALPLTAIAMPTPPRIRRPAPIWPYVVAAFLIFWIVAYASNHVAAAHRQDALAAFTAGIQANGALATPEAFQQVCGRAEGSSQTSHETVLSYGDFRIHFQPGRAVDLRRLTPGKWQQPMDDDFVFGQLQCKELHAQ